MVKDGITNFRLLTRIRVEDWRLTKSNILNKNSFVITQYWLNGQGNNTMIEWS